MIKLGVNIDHVSTVRQARGGSEPDLVRSALEACRGGADQITVHLREDRRHIQEADVFLLRRRLPVPLNLEMSVATDIVKVVLKACPEKASIVPERRKERTTEGGLEVRRYFKRLCRVIQRLREKRITVSLFIEPALGTVQAALEAGADEVEFHTGCYADLFDTDKIRWQREFERLKRASEFAHLLKLRVIAGHGLNRRNLVPIRRLPHLEEVNIGFSIVARSIFVGMREAVREIKKGLGSC